MMKRTHKWARAKSESFPMEATKPPTKSCLDATFEEIPKLSFTLSSRCFSLLKLLDMYEFRVYFCPTTSTHKQALLSS